jgi:hypothetical protein
MAHLTNKKVLLKKAGSIFVAPDKRFKKKIDFSVISNITPIMSVLIEYLEKHGKDVEGIFRVNGSTSALQILKEELANGLPEQGIDMSWDPHVTAGLIKLLLRELEEPLLLFNSYEHLLSALQTKDDKAQFQIMKAILDALPKENRFILYKLLDLFEIIDKNEQVTKMSAHNLAVVMGPTVMRPSGESFETMMSDSSKVVAVVTFLIQNAGNLHKAAIEPVMISAPVELSDQEMGKLSTKQPFDLRDKRDWKRKYEELKRTHEDVTGMYDELRTQYSVLEAYSAKLDSKVITLEEIIESMEQLIQAKPELDSLAASANSTTDESVTNVDEELQKLRQENDCLREVIIRSTREEVSNFREDSIRIRNPTTNVSNPLTKTTTISSIGSNPRLESSVSNGSLGDLGTLIVSNEEKPTPTEGNGTNGTTNGRKSLKVTNTFMRKQNSTKKIQKLKSSKLIEAENPKREMAHSTRPILRRETESDPKKVLNLLFATDTKPIVNNPPPPNPPTDLTATLSNQSNPSRTRRSMVSSETPKSLSTSFRSIVAQQPPNSNNNLPPLIPSNNNLPPLAPPLAPPSPSKPCPQRSLPPLPALSQRKVALSELSINTENLQPLSTRDENNSARNGKEEAITPRNGKSTILEVLQKMNDLQNHVSGKERTMETEQVEIRKQVEEMRLSLDTLVAAVTNLSEKLC